MSRVSPAAQAVLNQAIYKGPELEKRVAAALRAAADHLKQQKGWSLGVRWSADELLGIANELEAG